jgi:hypothetical protein
MWEVQGNYGHGWDMVTTEETLDDARATVKVYRENERGHAFRIRLGKD